jgi:hypothetical protein
MKFVIAIGGLALTLALAAAWSITHKQNSEDTAHQLLESSGNQGSKARAPSTASNPARRTPAAEPKNEQARPTEAADNPVALAPPGMRWIGDTLMFSPDNPAPMVDPRECIREHFGEDWQDVEAELVALGVELDYERPVRSPEEMAPIIERTVLYSHAGNEAQLRRSFDGRVSRSMFDSVNRLGLLGLLGYGPNADIPRGLIEDLKEIDSDFQPIMDAVADQLFEAEKSLRQDLYYNNNYEASPILGYKHTEKLEARTGATNSRWTQQGQTQSGGWVISTLVDLQSSDLGRALIYEFESLEEAREDQIIALMNSRR